MKDETGANSDYALKITRCHDFIHNPETSMTGIAISVQGRSHVLDGHQCEDFSGVKIEGSHPVFAVADGHSSAKKSFYGSKFAVESVMELIKSFEAAALSDSDIIRFFRARHAYKLLLDIWIEKVKAAENAAGIELDFSEKLKIASAYGSTLLCSVLCQRAVICFAIGDGGFFAMNSNKKDLLDIMSLCDFNTIGDAVNTSMCDLSPDAFLTSVIPRGVYDGVMIMSDGFEKPWEGTGRFERINELRDVSIGKDMDDLLYDFIINYAHPVESDDVTLVLGDFPSRRPLA
ncbi:MAG: protein phosphatase 2C domain-containing protein [Clostridiales bacterium]|jgi:hypothetical protein|nr:protein phosphatase 2C domain-containing protein [Clostridiales bacterium]